MHSNIHVYTFFHMSTANPLSIAFFYRKIFFSVSDQPHYLCINLSRFFLHFDSKRVGFFYFFHTNNNPFSQTCIYMRNRSPFGFMAKKKKRRKFILVALVFFCQNKNIQVKLVELTERLKDAISTIIWEIIIVSMLETNIKAKKNLMHSKTHSEDPSLF